MNVMNNTADSSEFFLQVTSPLCNSKLSRSNKKNNAKINDKQKYLIYMLNYINQVKPYLRYIPPKLFGVDHAVPGPVSINFRRFSMRTQIKLESHRWINPADI